MYRSRSLKGQTADCGSAMRQVSVESFVTFFGLMGAAVWATANLVDSRYSKNSSIWILNNRLFFAARAWCRVTASRKIQGPAMAQRAAPICIKRNNRGAAKRVANKAMSRHASTTALAIVSSVCVLMRVRTSYLQPVSPRALSDF